MHLEETLVKNGFDNELMSIEGPSISSQLLMPGDGTNA